MITAGGWPAPDTRPPWQEWAIGIAVAAAQRADCTRRRVGAAVFDADWRVLSTGYNGAPAGQPGCLTAGACPRGHQSTTDVLPGSSYDTGAGACIANHAEANALLYSDPVRRRGGSIAITCAPCDGCRRLLYGSGLAVAYWHVYETPQSAPLTVRLPLAGA